MTFLGANGQAAKYSLTYMTANDAPSSTNTPAVFLQASKFMGYEFTITLIKFNKQTNTISVSVKNTGIASTYHDFYITIQGQLSGSLKAMHPGDVRTVTVSTIDFAKLDITVSNWLTITSPKVPSMFTIPYAAATDVDPSATPQCTNNSQCTSPQVCNTSLQQCVDPSPPPECTSTADCPSDKTCDTSVNKCVVGGCRSNADCPAPGVCDTTKNQCVEPTVPSPQCTKNSDCDDGYICNKSNVCVIGNSAVGFTSILLIIMSTAFLALNLIW